MFCGPQTKARPRRVPRVLREAVYQRTRLLAIRCLGVLGEIEQVGAWPAGALWCYC